MYPVSNAYKTAMKQNTITRKLRGSINNISFTQGDILTGSAMITNKISDGTEIRIGSVNVGEFSATFILEGINDWQGAEITLEEGLMLSDSTYEYIPMGVFTVSDSQRSESGVFVKAYDNMSKFDKKITLSTSTGKAYDFLTYACSQCGVTLGMTQAEVEALPNGDNLLGLWTENDIETFRDLISWIAQTLACYATIDRTGRLVLRNYKSTPSDSIPEVNRYRGDVYSTFETRYSGVSVVDIKSQTTMYKGIDPDIYLTYNLGSNPFMQYGSKSIKEGMLTNILTSMQNIQYTPFNVTIPCGGAYDLGDVISFPDGYGDCTCCITNFTWRFYGADNYQAKGEGKDPALASAKSKTDKTLAGLASQVNAKEFQYYLFRNVRAINVGNGQERDIINMRFTSLSATAVIFQAEVLIEIDTLVSGITYNDAVAVVTYYIDNNKVMDYYPTETYVDGKHVLHLLYPMKIEGAQLTRFVATLRMTGGSAYIPPQGVNAIISGQSLMATDEWDGYIDAEDKFSIIDLRQLVVEDIFEVVTVTPDIPYEADSEDEFGEYALRSIQLENNFTEMLLIDKKMMSSYTHAELHDYTHAQLNNEFIHG